MFISSVTTLDEGVNNTAVAAGLAIAATTTAPGYHIAIDFLIIAFNRQRLPTKYFPHMFAGTSESIMEIIECCFSVPNSLLHDIKQ